LSFKELFHKMGLFKKSSNRPTAKDLETQMKEQLRMLQVMGETLSKPLPCAIVQPRVPHNGVRPDDSWFGGAPRLPDEAGWPEIDGKPGYFVAQINLASLPKELWGGLGPRSGWLSIFMSQGENAKPVVLYNKMLGEHREGPDQGEAEWFLPRMTDDRPYSTLPEWPVDIAPYTQIDGQLPAPAGFRKGMAPEFPDPRNEMEFDLTQPAFWPVNRESAVELFDLLICEAKSGLQIIERFSENPDTGNNLINPEDLKLFEAEINKTVRKIEKTKEKLLSNSAVSLPLSSIEEATTELSKIGIQCLAIGKVKSAEQGESVRQRVRLDKKTKPAHLSGRPETYWDSRYQKILYEHAKHLYAHDPANLSAQQKEWWGKIFAYDACYEIAAMGHMPQGELNYLHGPHTGMEVLIELKTSDLNGWIWGDLYSVVLLVPTESLRAGHFEGVVAGITN